MQAASNPPLEVRYGAAPVDGNPGPSNWHSNQHSQAAPMDTDPRRHHVSHAAAHDDCTGPAEHVSFLHHRVNMFCLLQAPENQDLVLVTPGPGLPTLASLPHGGAPPPTHGRLSPATSAGYLDFSLDSTSDFTVTRTPQQMHSVCFAIATLARTQSAHVAVKCRAAS